MKGLHLLQMNNKYTIRTQFNPDGYTHLIFSGYYKENDDVTLATFKDDKQGREIYFDISVPSNEVIPQTI